MSAFIAIGDVFWMAAGGAIVWMFKDTLMNWFMGAEAFASKLRQKADAVSAAVKK